MASPITGICSKCGATLDREGSPKWCKSCRAKYQREYEATKSEMVESRSFAAGCGQMRQFLADHFASFGNARFSGTEVWDMIRKVGVPR
jgi:predicted amidophosphoribosyltransferase